MHLYYAIFINSLQAYFMLAFGSENMWFAQLYFGGDALIPATVMAFLGSSAAMAVNYGIGFYLAHFGEAQWKKLSQTRVAALMQRFFVWILLFSFLPFSGIIAATAGLIGTKPQKALLIIVIGRAGYYLYQICTVYHPFGLFS